MASKETNEERKSRKERDDLVSAVLNDKQREQRVDRIKSLSEDVTRIIRNGMPIGEHYANELHIEMIFMLDDRARMLDKLVETVRARAPAESKLRMVRELEDRVWALETERNELLALVPPEELKQLEKPKDAPDEVDGDVISQPPKGDRSRK